MSMWDAPSDRDYCDQFNEPQDREEESGDEVKSEADPR